MLEKTHQILIKRLLVCLMVERCMIVSFLPFFVVDHYEINNELYAHSKQENDIPNGASGQCKDFCYKNRF